MTRLTKAPISESRTALVYELRCCQEMFCLEGKTRISPGRIYAGSPEHDLLEIDEFSFDGKVALQFQALFGRMGLFDTETHSFDKRLIVGMLIQEIFRKIEALASCGGFADLFHFSRRHHRRVVAKGVSNVG